MRNAVRIVLMCAGTLCLAAGPTRLGAAQGYDHFIVGNTADVVTVLSLVAGTALVASGASALNQIYERGTDALMQRTRLRPMADGRPRDARPRRCHALLRTRRRPRRAPPTTPR